MRMSEADYEYLIHTLSEARFRATEIAVSVRARVGLDHSLAQLGSLAVSKIDGVLGDVRKLAVEQEGGRSRFIGSPERKAALVLPEPNPQSQAAAFSLPSGLGPDHWLHGFLKDLTGQVRASNEITFEGAEKLLQQRKAVFLRDAETARRMIRTYPQLFSDGANQPTGT
jgi:hypothetical protein